MFDPAAASGKRDLLVDSTLVDSNLADFPVALNLDKCAPQLVSDLGVDKTKLAVTVFDEETVLLIHSDNSEGDTSFKDVSRASHAITSAGDVKHSTDQAKFGGSSIKFDGSGDYLAVADSPDFDFGTEDFTIDWWENLTTFVENGVVVVSDQNPGLASYASFLIGYLHGGESFVYLSSAKTSWDVASAKSFGTPEIGVFHHKAIVRHGSSFYMFLDGGLVQSWTSSLPIAPASGLALGPHNNAYFDGYLDEIRISKGIARWTEDFTPQDAPYWGLEQCPVEIECWEESNHVIHTKLPFVSASVDTTFNLTWDKFQDANSDFVGVTGSDEAKGVWESNFVGIYHMAQDPTGGVLLDSIGVHSGTLHGTVAFSDLVDAAFGKAIIFNGVDSYANLNSILGAAALAEYTIELQIKTNASGSDHSDILFSAHASNDDDKLRLANDTKIRVHDMHSGSTFLGGTTINDDAWHVVSLVGDGTAGSLFIEGLLDGSGTHDVDLPLNGKMSIGQEYDPSNSPGDFARVTVGSVRVSKVARTVAWVKASSFSLQGLLVKSAEYTRKAVCQINAADIDAPLYNFPVSIAVDSLLPSMASELRGSPLKMKVMADAFDEETVLLIHSDNPEGDTDFNDRSRAAHNITRGADGTHSTEQAKFGDSSIKFAGGGGLYIPDAEDWDFGAGDFTIDLWVNHLTAGSPYYPYVNKWGTAGNKSWWLGTHDGGVEFYYNDSSYFRATTSLPVAQWIHVAAIRSGTSLSFFFDGVLAGSFDIGTTAINVTPGNLMVGYDGVNGNITGYMDEIRISKGIARWTEDFTPPIAPYGLAPHTETECPIEIECWEESNHAFHTKLPFVLSSANTKFTVYWDGVGPDNPDFVGVTGSDPAKAVWDDNFAAVYHMAQDPSQGGACILDSTSNEKHGTPSGSMASAAFVNSDLFGKAIEFDGSNDLIDIGAAFSFTHETLEAFFQMSNPVGEWPCLLSERLSSTIAGCIKFDGTSPSYALVSGFYDGTWRQVYHTPYIDCADGEHHHIAFTYDRVTLTSILDGVVFTQAQTNAIPNNASSWRIGARWDAENLHDYFKGLLVEVRMSTNARSVTWAKATDLLLKGTLLTVLADGGQARLKIKSSKVPEAVYDFPIAIDLDARVPALPTDLQNESFKMRVVAEYPDNFTKLLIHSDNTEGDTNFKDSSNSGHIITPVNGADHSTDQAKFGGSSIKFDGSDDYLDIPASDDFDFSTDDFTIDFWLYCSSFANDMILLSGDDVGAFFIGIHNGNEIGYGRNAVAWDKLITHSLSVDSWHHVAIIKISGILSIVLDGVFICSDAYTGCVMSGGLEIGAQSGINGFSGYLDEIRISKGIARWTEDFTPPIAPYKEETECPIEIECWEENNHVIHTKLPFVSALVDTYFTIFWGGIVGNNFDFVGVSGSEPAKDVWDSDFVAVYHMAQDPSIGGACILDSTSNENHGTPQGSMTADDLVDSDLFGKAIDFDGADDFLLIASSPSLALVSLTLETRLLLKSNNNDQKLFSHQTSDAGYKLGFYTDGAFELEVHDGSTIVNTRGCGGSQLSINTWYNLAAIHVDNTRHLVMVDGVVDAMVPSAGVLRAATTISKICSEALTDACFGNQRIGSLRISKIDRSDAWILLTNKSLTDDLLSIVTSGFNYQEAEFSAVFRILASASKAESDDYYIPINLAETLPAVMETLTVDKRKSLEFYFKDTPLPAEVVEFSDSVSALYFLKGVLFPQADVECRVYWDGTQGDSNYVLDVTDDTTPVFPGFLGVFHFESLPSAGADDSSFLHNKLIATGIDDADKIPGRFGSAYYLDGAGAALESAVADYSAIAPAFTLTALLNIKSAPAGTHEILNFGVAGSPAISIVDGNFGIGLSGSIVDSGVAAPINAYCLVSLRYDGANVTLSLDEQMDLATLAPGSVADLSTGQITLDSAVEFEICELLFASTKKTDYWLDSLWRLFLQSGIIHTPSDFLLLDGIMIEDNPFGTDLLVEMNGDNVLLLETFIRQQSGYHIKGVVSIEGAPVHRRVSLLERRSLQVKDAVWSDPSTGGYRFEGVDPSLSYVVLCDDYNQEYNAAVADWVLAKDEE